MSSLDIPGLALQDREEPLARAEISGLKGAQRIAVCIPARDESATLGPILDTVAGLHAEGIVDDVIVIDDHSADRTADVAARHGATVLTSPLGPGKGQALSRAARATDADLLLFLDADVRNFNEDYVTALLIPLLRDPATQLVKARYRRPLDGVADEGGRVTEILARPLLRRHFPQLASIAQPLAGECALRQSTLEHIVLADGYGIEIALLIDVANHFGLESIRQVDLGERIHRNRPLHQLRPHCDDVLDAVLARLPTTQTGARR